MSIIYDLPDTEYHALPSLGSTTAKLALRSTRLLRDRLDGIDKVEDKAHFQIGRIAHMRVLEPDRYKACVVASGPINPKTGSPYGRETKAYAEWQAENPGKIVAEPWLDLAIERMPVEVADLLTGGKSEVSVFADIGGVQVKCRDDYLRNTHIVDLKTCADVDDAERIVRKLDYWFSAAWYRAVMLAETGKNHTHDFVFMEKNPPYRWRIVSLDASYGMYADDKVAQVIERIGAAQKSGDWSDHDDIEVMLSLPDYMVELDDFEGEVA